MWIECMFCFYTNIVSSFLFFVSTVPGLCCASGCFSSSDGQLLTCQNTEKKVSYYNSFLENRTCEANSIREGERKRQTEGEKNVPPYLSRFPLPLPLPHCWLHFYWPDWLITSAWGHKTRPSLPGSKTRRRHQSFPRDRFCRYDECSLERKQQRNKFRIRDLKRNVSNSRNRNMPSRSSDERRLYSQASAPKMTYSLPTKYEWNAYLQ